MQPKNVRKARRFARFLEEQFEASSATAADLAHYVGVAESTVDSWRAAKSRPHMRSIPAIADAFGVDRMVVCRAAGRPVDQLVRKQFANDPLSSIPGILQAEKDAKRLTTAQFAEESFSSMHPTYLSMLLSGSVTPGKRTLTRLSAGLDESIVKLTEAAWPGKSPKHVKMRAWAKQMHSPIARAVRAAIEQAGGDVAAAARACRLPVSRLVKFSKGELLPTVEDACKLTRIHLDLWTLLVASGVEKAEATQIAEAFKATGRRRRRAGGQDLLRELKDAKHLPAAKRPSAARTWTSIADDAGIAPSRLYSIVNHGSVKVKVREAMSLADVLDAPRDQVLAAFGWHR